MIFVFFTKGNVNMRYPEHNDRYLTQCYYNLQEKYDRRIISNEEWEKIYNIWHHYIVEGE